MVKNSFIEKTYVVGTHWNCLIEAIPMCIYNIMFHVNMEKNFRNLLFPSIMSTAYTSFEHAKLPISIKIPVTLLLHDVFFSKNEFMIYLFANLLVARL